MYARLATTVHTVLNTVRYFTFGTTPETPQKTIFPKAALPPRYSAFKNPVVATPAELNLEESTTVLYRLMSTAELSQIIETGIVGNCPTSITSGGITKRSHHHMPEHVQENNSALFSAYTRDMKSAITYAGVNIIPNFYALVKSNLPPVYAIPSDHAQLDQDIFNAYHEYYRLQEMNRADENRTRFVPAVNASLLCTQQVEVDLVINTPTHQCDFRPAANEMIIGVNFLWGGFRNFTFVSKPEPLVNNDIVKRDWAIEVLCPVNTYNYEKMLQNARDNGHIPAHSRPLTVDDAVMIFAEFKNIFPASADFHPNHHVHILKYVPESLPVGSPEVLRFLIEEHSLFRKKHNSMENNEIVDHHYYEPRRLSE
jgi:hypothetical protein